MKIEKNPFPLFFMVSCLLLIFSCTDRKEPHPTPPQTGRTPVTLEGAPFGTMEYLYPHPTERKALTVWREYGDSAKNETYFWMFEPGKGFTSTDVLAGEPGVAPPGAYLAGAGNYLAAARWDKDFRFQTFFWVMDVRTGTLVKTHMIPPNYSNDPFTQQEKPQTEPFHPGWVDSTLFIENFFRNRIRLVNFPEGELTCDLLNTRFVGAHQGKMWVYRQDSNGGSGASWLDPKTCEMGKLLPGFPSAGPFGVFLETNLGFEEIDQKGKMIQEFKPGISLSNRKELNPLRQMYLHQARWNGNIILSGNRRDLVILRPGDPGRFDVVELPAFSDGWPEIGMSQNIHDARNHSKYVLQGEISRYLPMTLSDGKGGPALLAFLDLQTAEWDFVSLPEGTKTGDFSFFSWNGKSMFQWNRNEGITLAVFGRDSRTIENAIHLTGPAAGRFNPSAIVDGKYWMHGYRLKETNACIAILDLVTMTVDFPGDGCLEARDATAEIRGLLR